MFFKNISEELGTVPEYMITDILVNDQHIAPAADPRSVLGKQNTVQGFGKMSAELQRTVTQISSYILSQQIPLLANLVVYESLIAGMPTGHSELNMPTRYLCRVGELIVVPLKGTLTMQSTDFPGVINTMTPGKFYRINNRIDSYFESSKDFVACCYNFLDFDLKRYLMPHDINSPFIRRQDEHVNPAEVAADPESPADAY
jgi:hypothetical protein